MVRNLANLRYLGMQTNLASQAEPGCASYYSKGFRRRLIEDEIQKHIRCSASHGQMVFGFNHGLIRIKRRCATINCTMLFSYARILDLILIVDFNFNQMIAPVVNPRKTVAVCHARVKSFYDFRFSHRRDSRKSVHVCYQCLRNGKMTSV